MLLVFPILTEKIPKHLKKNCRLIDYTHKAAALFSLIIIFITCSQPLPYTHRFSACQNGAAVELGMAFIVKNMNPDRVIKHSDRPAKSIPVSSRQILHVQIIGKVNILRTGRL